MNRFSDRFQSVTDRSLFGPNVPHGMNTLLRWLTNSGCVAQALSSLTHSSTVRQTIKSACPSNYIQTCVPLEGRTHRNIVRLCRSWIFLRLTRMKNRLRSGKQRTMSRGDHWTHVRSKLLCQKEIQYLWDMEVCEYSTEAEARVCTGRNPVGLKWIDTNNGSAEAPRYRSRLVCTEVRHKGVEPIFSATPPLETLRVLLCVAYQEYVFRIEDPFLISITDVSRANFDADVVRDVHVRLPDEDPKAKQPGVCGKLRKTMYGSLDAAQRWRALRSSFGDWRIFPRRGVSVSFFPQRPAELHSGARRCFFFHSGRQEE